MNWKDYSSLKSDGNASFAKEKVTTREAVAEVVEVTDDDGNITTHGVSAQPKQEREFIVLIQKSWDGSTGVANADSKREYSLLDLEGEKARLDSDIVRIKEQSDGLQLAITDFKEIL